MTSPDDLAASGQLLSSKLRLLRPLRKGGMSNVWVAEHLTLRTEVAVKLLSAERMTQPTLMARFLAEASAAARVRSPHVVVPIDHGVTDDGVPYIAMELLDGETLGDKLARDRILSVEDTAQLVRQLASALGAAHRLGIIHRDIKPDNLFLLAPSVGDSGEHRAFFVKVLDFGVAKQQQQDVPLDTTAGTSVGTPLYMSPEQVLEKAEVDAQADLWALAVVAYQSLTGSLPFSGETLGALCVAIAGGAYRPASERDRTLPPALDAWFERAFHQDRAQRFADAAELAATFVEATQSERHSYVRAAASDRPPARRRTAIAAAALGLLLLTVGLVARIDQTSSRSELVLAAPSPRAPLERPEPEAAAPLPDPAPAPAAAPSASASLPRARAAAPRPLASPKAPAVPAPKASAAARNWGF